MRTGREYREALRDGRRVWVMGEGPVDDVTAHPATRAMVDEYATWYDRHFAADWQDLVLTPPDGGGRRVPWAFVLPRSPEQLRAMGRCYCMAEILRILPGSSLVVAPSDSDLTSTEIGAGLEESFGAGRYTALQRSALLQLAADHVISALDGRESAFELHANGGIPAWRDRLRRYFGRYNELANGVLGALSLEMPAIDLTRIRELPVAPRRPVSP